MPGKVPPIDLCLRRGNPGINNAKAEREAFPRRTEYEWPIARTEYVKFHLTPRHTLELAQSNETNVIKYEAPKGAVFFQTLPFDKETEVTGHPVVRLSVCLRDRDGSNPSELDIFVTLRHFDAEDNESKPQDHAPASSYHRIIYLTVSY